MFGRVVAAWAARGAAVAVAGAWFVGSRRTVSVWRTLVEGSRVFLLDVVFRLGGRKGRKKLEAKTKHVTRGIDVCVCVSVAVCNEDTMRRKRLLAAR